MPRFQVDDTFHCFHIDAVTAPRRDRFRNPPMPMCLDTVADARICTDARIRRRRVSEVADARIHRRRVSEVADAYPKSPTHIRSRVEAISAAAASCSTAMARLDADKLISFSFSFRQQNPMNL